MSADKGSGREVVCVGWGARSRPIWRYRDEMALPDHRRASVAREDLPERYRDG